MESTKEKLIPEFQSIFNIIEPNEEIIELVSGYSTEEQEKFYLALKEIIQDDITLILMLFQAKKLAKNETKE